jgi:membrane associated rhomboid family serine protease
MVTLVLIAANVAVFGIELSQGADIDAFVRRWGLVPADVRDGPAAAITLLTCTFLHAGWFHLGSNMLYLGVFGFPLEQKIGRARFALMYVVSALVGSLVYVLAQPLSETPAIGASGAVSGVIAARLMLFLHVVESGPILLLLVLWVVTQLLAGIASLSPLTASTGIVWWAHLGGFASGLVLAPLARTWRMAR